MAAEQAAKQVSDAAQVVHDDLSSQLQTRTKEKEALLILLKDTQAQNDSLRHHLTDAEQRAAAATGDLAQAHASLEKLEGLRVSLASARDEEARGRSTAETALRSTRELLETIRGELVTATERLEQSVAERASAEDTASIARSQADAAEAKLSAVTGFSFKASAARVKILERTQADQERIIRELQARLQSPSAAPGCPRLRR